MKKNKVGRPTDNPKELKKTIKFDSESAEVIQCYMKKNNIETFSEAVRKIVKEYKSK